MNDANEPGTAPCLGGEHAKAADDKRWQENLNFNAEGERLTMKTVCLARALAAHLNWEYKGNLPDEIRINSVWLREICDLQRSYLEYLQRYTEFVNTNYGVIRN